MRAVAAALLLLGLGGCGGSRGIELRIGAAPTTSYLPVNMADSLGYFQEEGLKVKLDTLASTGQLIKAVLGGSVAVALVSYDQTLQAVAAGADVKSFYTLSTRPMFVVVARPEIRRVEDLKGRTIGISALGAAAQNVLNLILLKHGVQPKEVTVIGIGSNTAAAASIENGKVDAAMLTRSVYETVRERRPDIKPLLDTLTEESNQLLLGVPQAVQTVVIAKTDWLARNPDTARRVARALRRASRWLHEQPIEVVGANLPESFGGPGSAPALRALQAGLPVMTTDGHMPKGGPEAIRDYLRLAVDPALEVDLAKTYTEEFLEPKQ